VRKLSCLLDGRGSGIQLPSLGGSGAACQVLTRGDASPAEKQLFADREAAFDALRATGLPLRGKVFDEAGNGR